MEKKKKKNEDLFPALVFTVGVTVLIIFLLSTFGCSAIEATGGRVEVSATGGPGALLSKLEDLKMGGTLQTTPGGFTTRNNDPGIGAISNEDGGIKDVDIYTQKVGHSGRRDYVLYRGPAEVQTPGWIKILNEETGQWEKIKTERWIKVDGLESIHFESSFRQEVTLRLRLSEEKIQEIKFDTYGRKQYGSAYKRINTLFIRLPESHYRFEVFSYTGKSIFKSAKGQPYTRSLYINTNPADTQVGNTWIGWELIL